MANLLIRSHGRLLDEMMEVLPRILGTAERDSDEAEDADDISDPVEMDVRPSGDQRATCAKLLMSAIRSRSRSLALGRRGSGGRVGRVLKFLDGRLPPIDEMKALGGEIITLRHIRTLSLFGRVLVMSAPAWFGRFRRSKDVRARHYTESVTRLIEENRLCAAEVDVIILTMLKNTRLLLESNPEHLAARSRHNWVEEIKGHYALQVFVDEATDFSAVQLACTFEMCHPRLRSWFACGDLNQRIAYEGIRSLNSPR